MAKKLVRSAIYWMVLSPLMVLNIFPFAVMFFTPVKPRDELFLFPPRWLPSHFVWQNFVDMWRQTGFGTSLFNSLYVSITSAALAVILAVPAAYALSRSRFGGQRAFGQYLLVTQMISPMVLVLGLLRLLVLVGGIDNDSSLIFIYAAFNFAFTVMMLQSYFDTIGRDIEEASWIDGATRLRSLIRIFLPLAVPAIVVSSTVAFINAWNEFVIALTILRSSSNYTLPLLVYGQVAGRYQIEWHQVMAATLLATVPAAVVFLFLQRYLITGMTAGAVK
jgi:multiple sugar transport system permease protein